MKVKEKMWGHRGRPRKFAAGEVVEWRLRVPADLLMELRVCARIGERSVNDEIIARLLVSLNYQPHVPIIKTADGQRIIGLAVKFEEWLAVLLSRDKQAGADSAGAGRREEILFMWREGERVRIPGKTSSYSLRIPDNLAAEIRIMARLGQRSLNDEMLTRLMNSMGYFTERTLDHNEDVQALKVLCTAFEWYLREKISEVESTPLPWNKPE